MLPIQSENLDICFLTDPCLNNGVSVPDSTQPEIHMEKYKSQSPQGHSKGDEANWGGGVILQPDL